MGTSNVTTKSSGIFETHAAEETKRIAEIFVTHCAPNDVVGLKGTLGAGKTCFVKGMARGLGFEADQKVTSPTFVLHKEYMGDLTLHHFDAYRLEGAQSMIELGSDEVFADGGISAIEWADHVIECLPEEHFMWLFRITGCQVRELQLHVSGPALFDRFEGMQSDLQQHF
ncbi:MAG: tRNA (adenosine(37)-N6)-threonylcarbamoyltransferase complex ATPase subunit type 1 TsaE [Planctomycetota bacterium]